MASRLPRLRLSGLAQYFSGVEAKGRLKWWWWWFVPLPLPLLVSLGSEVRKS
jgi:hypothetical protein